LTIFAKNKFMVSVKKYISLNIKWVLNISNIWLFV